MNIAIISAAGKGLRMGKYNLPKQYIEVGDEPVYITTLKKFIRDDINMIILIISLEWEHIVSSQLKQFNISNVNIVYGDVTAEGSRYKALQYLNSINIDPSSTIIFHDAVRPNVSPEMITSVIKGMEEYTNIVPKMICKDSMLDTNYESVDGSKLIRLQTPQAFRFEDIYNCYKDNKWGGSPAITYINGGKHTLQFIQGDESNFKITTQDDLELYKKIIDYDKS